MTSRRLAVVVTFTALSIASDYALTDALNVKLVDPIVFSVAFVFGLEVGVYVGVLSELIWGTLSPWGFGGYIIPFLAGGEVLFALAGWAAARLWADENRKLSARNVYFGAALALCAFVWDFETNAATALIEYGARLTLAELAGTEAAGLWPFMVAHEVSDFATGAILAPIIIFYSFKFARQTPGRKELLDAPLKRA